MGEKMTDEEWRTFVSSGTRTGKLATVRADGSPHVAPVWFVLDGDDFVFNTGAGTVKGRNLARDGRATLCVDDESYPYSFAVLSGRARLSDDLDEMRHWATVIAARYVDRELAETYGARNAVAGELLVRVAIDRVVSEARVAE
ncbi:PPOX class F420-dependent oxidoreductase [Streptomyces sp. NBC_01808]|uniref:PPOX class F420-dependent oxidoreductase n=1 Tax=Streptomyces sp. NBC_01808 TaxID=2975947 RepID=UPI002DDA46E5|nr:PPOX class F420-dependent oxidoreductase [Streptomyces sp. NBC_01808]WSA36522.1 PPOX class F420-dependent oxidoreductase [Streptomyces sp. NBC_01808]